MADEKINIIVSLKDNASKGISSLKGGFSSLSATALRFAKVALVAVSAAIGKATLDFMKFEKGITNVYTLLGKDDFNKFGASLEKGALKTMEKFGFGIEETNKALFDTVSAGVGAGDAIKFLDVSAKLAVGGVTGISIAVDGLTSVMNAYGKENFDAAQAANVFFTAQKFGRTTVEELAGSIGQVAPIANAAGLSFEETAAAMSTLTLAGLSTAEATTSVKAILNSVIKPASESAKAFEDLGIKTVDANGEMRPFGDILKDIQVATGGNVQAVAKLFPNIRALGGATAFTSGKLDEYNNILKATQTDTTSLDEAFKKQMATLDRQRKILGSSIQVLGIQFASKFAPALLKVNEALIKLLQSEKVRALFDSLGKTLGFIVSVITQAVRVIGFLVSGLWNLIKPLMPAIGFISKLVFGFIALVAAIALLTNPIFLVIAGLALLGKTFDLTKDKISDGLAYMKDAFFNLGASIQQGVNTKLIQLLKFLNILLKGVNLLSKVIPGMPKMDLGVEDQIAKLEEQNVKLQEQKDQRAIDRDEAKAQRDLDREEQTTIDDEDANAKLAKQEQLDAQTLAQKKKTDAAMKKLDEERAKNFDSTLSYMSQGMSSNNKTVFAIGKAASIAQATMSGVEAVNKALASAPPPFNYGLAAGVGAVAASNVSKIASTQMAEGGIVMPTPGGTQATIGEAGSAEAVIPLDSPEASSMLGKDITVNINGKALAKEFYEINTQQIKTGEVAPR